MADYIYLGTLPLEHGGLNLRVEPTENGTKFSADLPSEVERDFVQRGLIVPIAPKRKGKDE